MRGRVRDTNPGNRRERERERGSVRHRGKRGRALVSSGTLSPPRLPTSAADEFSAEKLKTILCLSLLTTSPPSEEHRDVRGGRNRVSTPGKKERDVGSGVLRN